MDYQYKIPIDMPRGTHYGNNFWQFHSRKLGRRVTAYSNLEYNNLITLEMDHNVVHYCEQPCEQIVNINGESHRTVFDAYVVHKDGSEEFQEIKYSMELVFNTQQGDRSRKQIEIQRTWCVQNGYPYTVRTEEEIETGKYTIRNLAFLCAKARRIAPCSKASDISMIQFLSEHQVVSIGQMISMGRLSSAEGLDYLADLYYRGIIRFSDIDSVPITAKTEVILNGEQEI